jgi:hypothetical protein
MSGIFSRPIFVVAPPRSGTTLLFNLLARSRDLWTVGGESHFIIEAIEKLQPWRRNWDSNRFTATDADPYTVRLLVHGFVAALRNCDGQRPDPPLSGLRLLEKTPRNCLRVPFFAAAFPDARFLYLYREPRDTVSSMLDAWRSRAFITYPSLPGWSGPPWSLLLTPGWRELAGRDVAEIAARQWAVATSILFDDLQALPPDRWCVARYDRMIAEPQEEMERLCAWIGAKWSERVAAPLPPTRSTLTAPHPDKWRRNQDALERVMPAIDAVVQRAREVASA